MKTEKQINQARDFMVRKLISPGLTDMQRVLFAGMLNALVWAADGKHASTVDRLLTGEPLRDDDAQQAIEVLRAMPDLFKGKS